MAYYQGYYDYPSDMGYQEDAQYLGMGDTEMMYYQDQYDQNNLQFQQGNILEHQQLLSGQRPIMHRHSVTSCKT